MYNFWPSLEVFMKKEEERKKNWPLLDLSASPQVKKTGHSASGAQNALVKLRRLSLTRRS